jgi:hypothetical protein
MNTNKEGNFNRHLKRGKQARIYADLRENPSRAEVSHSVMGLHILQ